MEDTSFTSIVIEVWKDSSVDAILWWRICILDEELFALGHLCLGNVGQRRLLAQAPTYNPLIYAQISLHGIQHLWRSRKFYLEEVRLHEQEQFQGQDSS